MILNRENPQECTKKLLKLIKKVSKVAEYKINILKIYQYTYNMQEVVLVYTFNECSKSEIKKIILCIIT